MAQHEQHEQREALSTGATPAASVTPPSNEDQKCKKRCKIMNRFATWVAITNIVLYLCIENVKAFPLPGTTQTFCRSSTLNNKIISTPTSLHAASWYSAEERSSSIATATNPLKRFGSFYDEVDARVLTKKYDDLAIEYAMASDSASMSSWPSVNGLLDTDFEQENMDIRSNTITTFAANSHSMINADRQGAIGSMITSNIQQRNSRSRRMPIRALRRAISGLRPGRTS